MKVPLNDNNNNKKTYWHQMLNISEIHTHLEFSITYYLNHYFSILSLISTILNCLT